MPTRINYRPVRDFASLANTVNRLMDEDMRRRYDYAANGGSRESQSLHLPVNAYATENEFVLSADLPGVDPAQVEITFEGAELTIRGEFRPTQAEADYLMQERVVGAFQRTLTFNVPVDGDKIDASFENGVLTLVVPKAESVRPKQIKVRTV